MEKISEVLGRLPEVINTQESKKVYKSLCYGCNKEFEPIELYQKYCSDECKRITLSTQAKHRIDNNIKNIIPLKYQGIDTDRKDLIDRYCGKNLFITGGPGVGKTVLMASVAKLLIMRGEKLQWLNYSAFIMDLQSMFKKDCSRPDGLRAPETPFDVAEKIAKFDGWLCIDDIGAEKLTDYVRQITYFIINEREQRMLPIIITSNFSLLQIDEMVDPRVSSRIAGMCETIRLTGNDRRIHI